MTFFVVFCFLLFISGLNLEIMYSHITFFSSHTGRVMKKFEASSSLIRLESDAITQLQVSDVSL